MDKIRIGNDIQLVVSLSDKFNHPINIHSILAFFINESLSDKNNTFFGDANCVSRFPIEPCLCHEPTQHKIHQTGCPQYHAKPTNGCCRYNGFGVYPHTFESKKYNGKCCFLNKKELIKYMAAVELTADNDCVFVYFPAEDLLETGIYSLVITAKYYQPGYSTVNNFKTVTTCYNNLFELVNTTYSGNDVNETCKIYVGNVSENNNYVGVDRYVTGGQLTGDDLILNRSDGINVDPINLSDITAWYIDES